MLLLVHQNPARLESGTLLVDRKFHTGITEFVKGLGVPALAVHPRCEDQNGIMDAVSIPASDCNYEILVVDVGRNGLVTEQSRPILAEAINRSTLVYGQSLGAAAIAKELGVPCIQLLEYDLNSQIVTTTTQVTNPVRKAVRAMRVSWDFAVNQRRDIRDAIAVHCNGYPIYDVAAKLNSHVLLYLDSRITSDMVITPEETTARLERRKGKPLRLLYSGRFEPMKGAIDVIRVALECQKRGLDIEMHAYGKGSLKSEMTALAAQSPVKGSISIHDAVPFDELFENSKSFDVFVCCHIQADPSCSYLEAMGAGLPVIGYANRMLQRITEDSGAGLHAPLYKPAGVAERIGYLASDEGRLAAMTRNAASFAREHTFDREMAKRRAAVLKTLDELSGPSPAIAS